MPCLAPAPPAAPDGVTLMTITINFDVHVLQVLAPLAAGAALVVAKPGGHLDGAYVAGLLAAHRVTAVLGSVPTLVRARSARATARVSERPPARALF